MKLNKALKDGWAVKIWPNYYGYTVVFNRAGDDERIARGATVKQAVKKALRGVYE